MNNYTKSYNGVEDLIKRLEDLAKNGSYNADTLQDAIVYIHDHRDDSEVILERYKKFLSESSKEELMKAFEKASTADVGLSLVGMDSELEEKALGLFSKRMAAMIRSDIEFMGNVRDIDKADAADRVMKASLDC